MNVWGAVGQPGLWRIERSADLVEFLSVVGVPGVGENQLGTRSKVYVTIYRTHDGRRREIYRQNVENILEAGARYPVLQDRDVLEIETVRRRKIGFRVISTIVGTISSVTSLVLLLTRSR